MLNICESSRENPTKLICTICNKEVSLVVHHDYIEGYCCDKKYAIKLNNGFWNCCSFPDNPLLETIEKIQKGEFDPYNTYSNFHKSKTLTQAAEGLKLGDMTIEFGKKEED